MAAPDNLGIVIHGMGGLGKSSLAARLCDRLSRLQPVIVFGRLDEAVLVQRLSEVVADRDAREMLQDPAEELKYRLRGFFGAELDKDVLVVLDDFEENLDGQRLQPTAKKVLDSLVWALSQLDTVRQHRVMITCRYLFGAVQGFVEMPLDGFAGADLVKKCRRLTGFKEVTEESPLTPLRKGGNLVERALGLADGNPRLLERLNTVLTDDKLDREAIVSKLEGLESDDAELRQKVLAESLLAQVDGDLARLLGRAKIYELPVPRDAILVLAAEEEESPLTPLWKGGSLVERAVSLGLLEVSPDGSLRVPRVVPLVVAAEEREILAKIGLEYLYKLWLKGTLSEIKGSFSEVIALELIRLAKISTQEEIVIDITEW